MKTLLTLFSISFALILQAQTPTAALETPDINMLYRGYANKIIPAVTNSNGKQIILSGKGISLNKTSDGYYIAKPGRGKTASISIYLADKKDTTFIKEVEYRVSNLPDPSLYLGKARIGSSADIHATELHVKYIPEIPLKAEFKVKKWSITVNEETISGTGKSIKSASELLKNAPNGAVVMVNVDVLGEDGITRMRTGNWVVEK